MAKFSNISLARLRSCHADLQRLFHAVIQKQDCAVTCGRRTDEEQAQAYADGNTAAKPGQSPHNANPSMAVDVMPYPIDWEDEAEILEFRNLVDLTAVSLGIELHPLIRFRNKKGQFIVDLPHYQLAEWKKP